MRARERASRGARERRRPISSQSTKGDRMKLFRTLLLAAVCLLALSAGADTSAGRTPPSPADAVRAADQEWMKVFAAKDLDKSVAFCAEDGSALVPKARIATGGGDSRT